MPLLEAIEKRRAYRALGSDPIDKELLVRLAEAAHTAPSSGNNQPWRLVTVSDPARLDALKQTVSSGNYWAKPAPAMTAFVTDARWSMRMDVRDLAFFELGMAAMAYQLQAVAEGLIAHPIVGFDAAAAKTVIGIPEDAVLEILVVLGWPGDPAALSVKHRQLEESERIRKPLDEVAGWDVWSDVLVPPRK